MDIKILSLIVKNSGALEDVKIDFTNAGAAQSIVVLGGANGSGKTTVLELIFSLIELLKFGEVSRKHTNTGLTGIFNYTEYAELELLIDTKKHNIFIYHGSQSFNKELYQNKHGLVHQLFADHSIEKSYIHKSEFTGNLCHIITFEQSKLVSSLFDKKNPVKSDVILSSPLISSSIVPLPLPSTIYFPHNRELLPVKGEQIHKEEIKYQWCYRYKNKPSFHGSLESYLIWLDYAEPEEFKVISDFMNQLDFGGKTFHINRKELSVIVRTKNGQHSFDKLSSGEQNILIMLLELYRRLRPGSIVLIDEIENSLHPAFYHHLAQNLLKLQKQIPFQLILTTHQLTFVKIFGEDCTRILTEF